MGLVMMEGNKIIEKIKKCCPDCGSTNTFHYSWCRIHETDSKVYENKLNMQREVFEHRKDRKWLEEHFGKIKENSNGIILPSKRIFGNIKYLKENSKKKGE